MLGGRRIGEDWGMRGRKLLLALLAAGVLGCCQAAYAGLVNPHVPRGRLNLRPSLCIAAHNVDFWDNRVFMGGAATSGAGPTVWAIEASDPDNLRCIGGAGSGYKAYKVRVFEDLLYAASWSTVLRIFDVTGGVPVVLGEYWAPGEFGWHLDVARGRVYLGEGSETQSKFYLFDVSNPASPQPVALNPLDRAGGVAVRGSYAYYTNNTRFEIANVSDELHPYVLASHDFGHMILGGVKLRGEYAYVYWSRVTDGGIYVFNVSDPAHPALVGSFAGAIATDMCLLGDYAFYTTSGNGFMTIDISDPANPRSVAQTNLEGYELCVTGGGRYVYVGILSGDNEGWLQAVEAFDSDPDDAGPGGWRGFSLGDASWDTQYDADVLPTYSNPRWVVAEGSQSWASVSGGVLRVNDTGTLPGHKIKWARNWNAANWRGSTVLVRARCASYDLAGGPIQYLGNVFIEDGRFSEEFSILSDRIRAVNANLEYPIDGTQWHTYRFTMQGGEFRVYIDEAAAPVISGTLSQTTYRSRVMFGSGSSQSRQDIYFDYVQCCSEGAFGPGGLTSDTTPDISVTVADTAGKDSLSGINPQSARVHWSTDGGTTWNSSGGAPWEAAYEAAALPSVSNPAWSVAEGSEGLGSVSRGVLRVNDTSTASGSKVKWSRSWGASSTTGATVVARARCASVGGDTSLLDNIYVEDGAYSQRFQILPDSVVAADAGLSLPLDGMRWHTYRITTRNGIFRLYVDEQPAAVMMGSMASGASGSRLMFGSGASAATQDVYFDYVRYTASGDLPPGRCAGTVTCSGYDGDDRGVISASGIPFNQFSQTLNKVRFSIEDMAGNTGWSPTYNVRIVSVMATGLGSLDPDRTYKLGERIYINVTFSQPVYVNISGGAPRLRLNSGQNAVATYNSGNGTNTLRFRYFVGDGDESPDLDCAGVDALMLNGGTINDAGGNPVSLDLPAPGAVGSLGYNKNLAVDARAPVVRITSPTSEPDWPSSASQITVAGTAIDGCGVTGVTWTSSRGGSGTCTGAGAWQASIPLAEGTNVITIRAVDAAGNAGTGAITVVCAPGGSLSIAEAKSLADSAAVFLEQAIVSAIFGDCLYIQEPDRSAGIKFRPLSMPAGIEVGSRVNVAGTIAAEPGGERCVYGSIAIAAEND